MEWIIGIGIVLIVSYFMFGRSETSPSDMSKGVAVKDFIDEEKVYTQEEAIHTVQQFIVALGDTKERRYVGSAQVVAKTLPRLLKKMKKEYREELRDLKEEIADINDNYKDQINDVKSDSDLDKDEKKEEIAELKIKWEEELNPFKREANRREKQIAALDENPKEALEKTLAYIKKEHSEGHSLPDLGEDILAYELVKEARD
tara:strand:- start:939 stop:1544 length:606 start_codon:yes stop_codon:yes gene_type:complete